ncbi:uncharacterized membrane protein YebE (DUF533 family) [Cricetibacter osteomyelitidis]|uniref:Uncharacterized membrane protein YebE (DUF533 family) n=1 Tax=Cricetibacter osteomyelitidis TaxID=1521931 RepID=A0A4R2T5G9_9PAST|nr:DUF533 domain-containing protein [Cricetibacter osteomyelitidis]TCP97660.1 uncharacterized membrane protein YebE (DUF533 family) [Cricetibacter osteomyelitidis]
MDFSSILNQVLDSVKDTMGKNDTAGKITKAGGGAVVIGVLSMILGRNGGSSLAKMGSIAVLGNLAYQAYQKYQQNQASVAQKQELPQEQFASAAQTVESGTVILRAMIAAALSDGELDEQEKQAILNEAGNDSELQQWLVQETQKPASIAQQVAGDQALAVQVYLAVRLVCGAELSRKEIVFLAQLADALKLNEQLVEQLEKQAGF